MKLIVASLFTLMTAAVVIQVASSTAFDFNSHSQASDPDAKNMEAKMAESLHSIALATPSGQPNGVATNGTTNQRPNESSINSSGVNQSINATTHNSSMLNGSAKLNGSGGSMIADSLSVSPQGLGESSKGAIKGFWGFQASKHVMGQSDVKSQMFLSGTFDVDKNVKFSDRGS